MRLIICQTRLIRDHLPSPLGFSFRLFLGCGAVTFAVRFGSTSARKTNNCEEDRRTGCCLCGGLSFVQIECGRCRQSFVSVDSVGSM